MYFQIILMAQATQLVILSKNIYFAFLMHFTSVDERKPMKGIAQFTANKLRSSFTI